MAERVLHGSRRERCRVVWRMLGRPPEDLLSEIEARGLFARLASRGLLRSIGSALDRGTRARFEAHGEFEAGMHEFNTE